MGLYAVVKRSSDSLKRCGVVQPHIGEDEEVEIGKLLFNPNCVSGLGGYCISAIKIHQREGCARLPVV